MTYVVGGTPRSGKTALKMLFLNKYKIPGFCTDYLRDAFEHAVPDFGIKDGMSDAQKSEILWPFFKGILNQRRKYYADNLLIEGTNFLPKFLQEFEKDDRTRILFLGYSEVEVADKFKNIKDFPSREGEWTSDMTDQELKDHIEQFIEISKRLKSECAKYGIGYFDTSRNFSQVIEQAAQYLIAK